MRRAASSKTSVISTSSWIAGKRLRNRGRRALRTLRRRSSSGLPSASSSPSFRRLSIRSPSIELGGVQTRRWGSDASVRAAGREENSAVRFRSGPAFYRIRTRNRAPNDSVDVQQGGIKLACPDALTEADLRRTNRRLSTRKVAHAGSLLTKCSVVRPARSSRARDAHSSSL